MGSQTDTFEILQQIRQEWVQANHKNDYDEGIKRYMTDLYPDNAHFIYELLQNAEDTQATEVHFTLQTNSLLFEHNGRRLFSLDDVVSITSIGKSTKRDDETSIGKFGVGFKAVFSYTDTPEVHSGDFHFRIRDLVVPEKIRPDSNHSTCAKTTNFVFPFNHQKKSAGQAVTEIEKGLRALGSNTLLFLSHIRKIDYRLPDDSTGSLERIDHDKEHIEIRAQHCGGNQTVSHWLRFEKDVEIEDDTGATKNCRIATAYKMEKETETKKKTSEWKIVPLDHGQVSIYFPAEKETSNLRFHIHAPFAPTISRDSVRDCPANDRLRDHLADLIVESLSAIRDMGMLNVAFLAVLPNPYDNLPPRYKPIQSAIIKAFQEQELTPVKEGGYAPSEALFVGLSSISELLKDSDLSLLTNLQPPLWAANAPPQHRRVEAFINSLEIDEWGWNDFVQKIESGDSGDRERINEWIAQKDDSWLLRFYALLEDACVVCRRTVLPGTKFIRVSTDNGDTYLHCGRTLFFPPIDNLSPPDDIQYVKKEVYSSGRSEENKKKAKAYLERLGIRPFDQKAATIRKLNECFVPQEHVHKSYLKDIAQFVEFYYLYPSERHRFKDLFFLRGKSQDGTVNWQKSAELYLDLPYLDTGLDDLFNDKTISLDKRKDRLLDDYVNVPVIPAQTITC